MADVVALQKVIDQLGRFGSADPAFSVVGADQGGADAVRVYRTDEASATSQTEYARLVPAGIAVTFHRSLISLRQKLVLHQLVRDLRDELAARGIHIQHCGSGSTGPFEVTYDGQGELDRDMRAALLIFGPETVVFQRGRMIAL